MYELKKVFQLKNCKYVKQGTGQKLFFKYFTTFADKEIAVGLEHI